MYNLKIDQTTRDLSFDGNGSLRLVYDHDEIMQQVERSLTTRQTEWFLNLGIGLDWEIIFAKPYDRVSVEREIRREITAVDGIAAVEQVTLIFNSNTRGLQVEFLATFEDGEQDTGVIEFG